MVHDLIKEKPGEEMVLKAQAGDHAILLFFTFSRSRSICRSGSTDDRPE
ncbi:MAG: hypothetical protein KQI81_02635 [Deltaproteobacteria bacterium]|nr:hypothetical protein [Deltaproteobacteria bacterium]